MRSPPAIVGIVGVFGTLLGTVIVTGSLLAFHASPLVSMVAGSIAGAWSGGCLVALALLMMPILPSRSLHEAIRGVRAIDEPGEVLELTDGPPDLLAEIRASTVLVKERRRRLEQQLADRAEALGREKRAVQDLREQMRQSLSVQDAFLSRMSHELRTPLNAITGYVEMLLEEIDPQWAPDLSRVRLASMNLSALVTSVLDLTDLQSGAYAVRPEPVLVVDLVHQVVDSVRFNAETHRNQIVVDADPTLVPTVDRRMLTSIVFNLVSNAAKYTTDGVVTVTVARSVQQPDRVEIGVADTGIGMTRRQIEEAFRPFRQADESSTRRYDGSGVGLAVVKGFVEAMAGQVELHSEPGKGARVTVLLPFEAVARSTSPAGLEEEPTVFLR